MCQRVYIASRSPLPSLKRSHGAPRLEISRLSKGANGVRRWFSREAKNFAEVRGSSACGCGFPELSDDRPERFVSDEDVDAVKALTAYLEKLPGQKYVAELLLCWIGDEDERPQQNREIGLEALKRTGFRFRRGEIVRVRAGDPNV